MVLLLFIGIWHAPAESRIGRDWAKYPAIVQIDTSEDIFAIGDVHGDYDRLVKLLTTAKIIEHTASPETVAPDAVTWIAGKAVLVFTGDLIDKGPHSFKVLQLAASLRKAAAGSGGRVVTLMGNHEAEFLSDPSEKKVKDFAHGIFAQRRSHPQGRRGVPWRCRGVPVLPSFRRSGGRLVLLARHLTPAAALSHSSPTILKLAL